MIVPRLVLREFAILAIAGAILFVADRTNPPLGYYASLAILVLLPGRGVPTLLFGPAYLSLVEYVLLSTLTSMFLVVGTMWILVGVIGQAEVSSVRTLSLGLLLFGFVTSVIAGTVHEHARADARDWTNGLAFGIGLSATILAGLAVFAIANSS